MSDMNAFERRLTAELERIAGPQRPVDASAIRLAATATTPTGTWSTFTRRFRGDPSPTSGPRHYSMVSAAKLVAAAAVVALFGGLLLAGVLTPQPDPALTPGAATASPTPGMKQLDIPEAGVAMAVPESWETRVESFTPALEPAGRYDLAAIVYASDADGDQGCRLFAHIGREDLPAHFSEPVALDAEVAARYDFLADYADGGEGLLDREAHTIRLPAGDATRVDFVGEGGERGSEWLLTDGEDLYQLTCEAVEPPSDGWRSIAETIRMLPVVAPLTSETAPAMSAEQRLAGLVTVDVEPGVARIVNDGVRDMADTAAGRLGHVRIDREGEPWLFGEDAFFRLGDQGMHLPPKGSNDESIQDIEFAPDGTLWLIRSGYRWLSDEDSETGQLERHTSGGAYAFDGQRWTEAAMPSTVSGEPRDLEILADGTIWTTWRNAADFTLSVFDGQRWEVFESPGCWLFPMQASDTDIYVDGPPDGITDCDGTLYRFDGSDWQVVETPEGYLSRGGIYGSAPVGADGTLWVEFRRASEPGGRRTGIARFDGTSWEEWDIDDFPDEGVQNPISGYFNFEAIAPDGSLWGTTDDCDGVGHLEGTTVTRYLVGRCINSTDLAPDGSLWVVTSESGGDFTGVYVIRP